MKEYEYFQDRWDYLPTRSKLRITKEVDEQVKIIKATQHFKEFFEKNGYDLALINIPVPFDETDEQVIRKNILLDGKKFLDAKKNLQEQYAKVKVHFHEILQGLFNKKINPIVVLTEYGVGGMYVYPNKVIINIKKKKRLLINLLHEITHLYAESYMRKYKISHAVKERIMDLLLNSEKFSFTGYDFWQPIHDDAKWVDELFEELFFDDVDKFFSTISLNQRSSDT